MDSQNKVVGRSTETCRLLDAANVDKVVQECRWQEHQADSSRCGKDAYSFTEQWAMISHPVLKSDTQNMQRPFCASLAPDLEMLIERLSRLIIVSVESKKCRCKCRALMALPEHVLHFAKTIKMDTKAMVHSLRKDVAVDNVMRIDLRHFCRSEERTLCL